MTHRFLWELSASAWLLVFDRYFSDPVSLRILLCCFWRRPSPSDLMVLVENLRLVSALPKEKVFEPCPVDV